MSLFPKKVEYPLKSLNSENSLKKLFKALNNSEILI